MLPARSKRYVGIDGEISRERLAGPWQLLLVLTISLLLFYVVYPQHALVRRLYDLRDLDELSLSYVQNLLRADPDNSDAALLMARQRVAQMSPSELQALVRPYLRASDPRQRQLAEELQLTALERELNEAGAHPASRPEEVQRIRDIVAAALATPDLDRDVARRYAWLASQVGLADLAQRLLEYALADATAEELERAAEQALAQGQPSLARFLFLLACDRSREPEARLRRLQRGVNILVAQGQPLQALQLAQNHLGPLSSYRAALRWMTRLALSAGEPQKAAEYARGLVFRMAAKDRAAESRP